MTYHLPLVSIVIPTFNNRPYLQRCLDSVFQTDYANFEVIVVDDSSSDDTWSYVERLKKDKENLTIIRNRENLGHTASSNAGFQTARGEFIAKLDEDTIVDRGWLAALVTVMLQDPSVGIAQSVSFRYHSKQLIPHASGVHFDRLGRTRYKMTSGVEEVFYPIAYALLIRAELLKRAGGFYPDYFIYYEEIDLGWRLRLMGYKVVVASSSIVRHMGAFKEETPWLMKPRRSSYEFHQFKNHISTLIINYEASNVVRYLLPCIMIIGFQALKELARGRVSAEIHLWRAILWNIGNFPRTYRRHCFTNRYLRKIPDTGILSKMSPSILIT